jgi:hypothetical protein
LDNHIEGGKQWAKETGEAERVRFGEAPMATAGRGRRALLSPRVRIRKPRRNRKTADLGLPARMTPDPAGSPEIRQYQALLTSPIRKH